MPRGVELAVLAAANLLALGSLLLAAARRGLPGGCRRGPPLRGAGHCAARRRRHRRVPRRLGPLRAHGGAARRPGRRRFGGAGGEHRRRGRGGGLYPADPGRPGLRCPFRHAPRRRHHRRLKRLVGRHRAVDAVPDLRLRVGGRGGRPAPPAGAGQGRTVDAVRLRRRGVLPVRPADQPVVLALRGRRRHRHLLRARRAAGHQPQQLPALLAGDVDGGLGHPACHHHDRRNRCGGAGHSRRTPAGEAGLQRGRASRAGSPAGSIHVSRRDRRQLTP